MSNVNEFVYILLGYCCTFLNADIYTQVTNGSYLYQTVSGLVLPSEVCGQITFSTQPSIASKMFIALLPGDNDSEPLYEIALGISGTNNYIRRSKQMLNNTSNKSYDLEVRSPITISWNNGSIAIDSIHLRWQDSTPLKVKNIAICSIGNNSVEWNFTLPVTIPSGCNISDAKASTAAHTVTTELAKTSEVGHTTLAKFQTSTSGNGFNTLAHDTSSQACYCPCSSVQDNKWKHLSALNLTKEEIKIILKDELEELKLNLTIVRTNTSFYMRTKISAPDNRMSSKSIGIVGVLIIVSVAILIVGSDLLNVVKTVRLFFQKRCVKRL